MRIVFLTPLLLATAPAFADDCLDEVRAMYLDEGGVFDPVFEIQHQEVSVNRMPDGTEVPVVTARWQAPDQVISAFPGGQYMLLWGQDFYQGASWDGPWTDTGSDNPYDAMEFALAMNQSAAASIESATCDGPVEVGGRTLLRYAYHVRTEPPGGQSWWESDQVVYVDPETGRMAITEEHNLMESWAPEPKGYVKVTTADYGAAFEITPPAE
ncbi:MAG: hypothetical protein VX874_16235 [Pseudomonadota bacterium]|nr:hypothetical protein [Pseudomonadota bacterium]